MSNYNPPPDEGAPTRPMNPPPTNPQQPYSQPPYQQNPYQQSYQQQPYGQYPQAQPPQKGGALKWVLIGCAGFLLIGALAVGGFVWYGYNRVKQAGVDPGLMRRNPALAIAKAAMMNNPDFEYISIDEAKNTITVKEKKTGKVITINANDLENGEISIQEDGKDKVRIKGDGEGGTVDIQTPEGSVKMGSGSAANLPSWLPQYPGVEITGTYAVDSPESSGTGFNFTTEDTAEEVIDFYEGRLREAGFKLSKSTVTQDGQTTASLTGNDADYKRTIVVSTSVVDGDTQVNIVSQTRK